MFGPTKLFWKSLTLSSLRMVDFWSILKHLICLGQIQFFAGQTKFAMVSWICHQKKAASDPLIKCNQSNLLAESITKTEIAKRVGVRPEQNRRKICDCLTICQFWDFPTTTGQEFKRRREVWVSLSLEKGWKVAAASCWWSNRHKTPTRFLQQSERIFSAAWENKFDVRWC